MVDLKKQKIQNLMVIRGKIKTLQEKFCVIYVGSLNLNLKLNLHFISYVSSVAILWNSPDSLVSNPINSTCRTKG